MTKRLDRITDDSLNALHRHHPYLLLLQKEDWRDYLLILAQIYDFLEEHRTRVPLDTVRPIVIKFYAGRKELSSLDQKIASFFAMAIGELEVLKDSHDQFGQRYIETTRSGKALLQWIESLVTQRAKFSGTGAELLLGALNDILISQRQPTLAEAIRHHQEKSSLCVKIWPACEKTGLQPRNYCPSLTLTRPCLARPKKPLFTFCNLSKM
jgi:hypothetical protein